MCSLNDSQVSDFVQAKKRLHGPMSSKLAVAKVGKQQSGVWVLNSNVTVNQDGIPIGMDENQYIWLGAMYQGPGIAREKDAIPVELPLNANTLSPLLLKLRDILKHNFFPGVLVVSACGVALHYETVLSKFLSCPVPIAFGPSGTGKTTALRSGLALVGSSNRLFSRGTKEKYLELCSESSFPIGIDDPSFQKDVDALCVDLFNGVKSGSITHGERLPITTAVLAANFTNSPKERYFRFGLGPRALELMLLFLHRYASRSVMIEFSSPQVDPSVTDYTEIPLLLKNATKSIGFMIS